MSEAVQSPELEKRPSPEVTGYLDNTIEFIFPSIQSANEGITAALGTFIGDQGYVRDLGRIMDTFTERQKENKVRKREQLNDFSVRTIILNENGYRTKRLDIGIDHYKGLLNLGTSIVMRLVRDKGWLVEISKSDAQGTTRRKVIEEAVGQPSLVAGANIVVKFTQEEDAERYGNKLIPDFDQQLADAMRKNQASVDPSHFYTEFSILNPDERFEITLRMSTSFDEKGIVRANGSTEFTVIVRPKESVRYSNDALAQKYLNRLASRTAGLKESFLDGSIANAPFDASHIDWKSLRAAMRLAGMDVGETAVSVGAARPREVAGLTGMKRGASKFIENLFPHLELIPDWQRIVEMDERYWN